MRVPSLGFGAMPKSPATLECYVIGTCTPAPPEGCVHVPW